MSKCRDKACLVSFQMRLLIGQNNISIGNRDKACLVSTQVHYISKSQVVISFFYSSPIFCCDKGLIEIIININQ